MKRIILFVLAAVMLFSMASCGNSVAENLYNAPEGKLTATNDAIDYYFFYPADGVWMPDRNDGMISILSDYDQVSGTCTSSISGTDFQYDPKTITTEKEYWEKNLDGYKNTFKDLTVTKEEEIKMGGIDGYYVEYTAKVTDKEYKFGQAMVFNINRVYILTYTTEVEAFATRLPVFTDAINTFSFK